MRVGNLELSSPVLVAPMVGITDAPCRALMHEFGAGMVCTEMVAAEAVVRSTDAAVKLLAFLGRQSRRGQSSERTKRNPNE